MSFRDRCYRITAFAAAAFMLAAMPSCKAPTITTTGQLTNTVTITNTRTATSLVPVTVFPATTVTVTLPPETALSTVTNTLTFTQPAVTAVITAAATATATATTTETVTLSGQQVLKVNLYQEPEQLDPNRASWAQELSVINQVFEGLLGFNQDLTLKPVAATEIPTVSNKGISPDGLTYTFTLRTDTAWSDGQKLTARDFEYSIKRLLDPDLACSYASFYYDIAGAQAYNNTRGSNAAAKAQLKAAVGVKATGDNTLEIKLAQPRPTFLQLMALWPVYPLREDIITAGGENWTEPATYTGNGPFVMTERVRGDHITLARNPNYRGGGPLLSQVIFRILDFNAALAAYKNGDLDICNADTASLFDPSLGPQVKGINTLSTYAFVFNVHAPPFDNLKLRQALACTLDRESYINMVRAGQGLPAYSWIPPGMPGYNASLGTEYAFNAARAKQLLAEAGYAEGRGLPELKFQYADTTSNRAAAQFLQAQLKNNLGINLTLQPMLSSAYSQMLTARQHTWVLTGWGADYPDPDNFLQNCFGTGGGPNYSTYSNPAFDTLAAQASKELDNTRRLELWGQAHALVMADAPIIPVYYGQWLVLVKPYLRGVKATPMDNKIYGDRFLKEIYIQR